MTSTQSGSIGEFEEPRQVGLTDLADVLRRDFWYFVLPAVLVAVLGVGFVGTLPEEYTSQATILVEGQQIPEDLVRSTVTSYVDERIEFIRQKVLTRSNIVDIIERFDLYGTAGEPTSALVSRFESGVALERVSSETRRRSATIAFSLSFTHPDPRLARLVANELATLFLAENAATRTERATETTEFLRSEAEAIQARIREAEARVIEFKQRNRDQLPELFQVNMAKLERVEREFQQTSLTLAGLERDLRFLYAQAQGAEAGTDPGEMGIQDLRAELAALRLEFTDSHPDVLRLRRLIEAREAEIARMAREEADASSAEAAMAAAAGRSAGQVDVSRPLPETASPSLVREIEGLRERIQFLRQSRADMRSEIALLEDRVQQAPEIEKEWRDLQRDLENLNEKYTELRDKELEARMAQTLEEEQKGERFVLLEPPLEPEKPSAPAYAKLYAMVTAVALSVGAMLVLLVEGLNPGLRGQEAIAKRLGTVPLASIPHIVSLQERRSRKRQRAVFAVSICVAVAASLWVVDALIMPYQLFLENLAVRVGLR